MRECYGIVGDGAETIALLIDGAGSNLPRTPMPQAPASLHAAIARTHEASEKTEDVPLDEWVNNRLLPLRAMEDADRRRLLLYWLGPMQFTQRYLLIKLLSGELRVGVSQTLVAKALAKLGGLPQATVAHRLAGEWQPDALLLPRMLAAAGGRDAGDAGDEGNAEISRPYPFFLATSIEEAVGAVSVSTPDGQTVEGPARLTVNPGSLGIALGDIRDHQLEWKWDGIRCQVIKRRGQIFIWSRGDELLTERFPEVVQSLSRLPPCVLDGELLCWNEGHPLPFSALQTRIGRSSLSRNILRAAPAIFMAYDAVELDGNDLREQPLSERRGALEQIVARNGSQRCMISEVLVAADWPAAADLRATSRARGIEGLMIKRKSSPYRAGRVRGDWWKWKIDPLTFDGVLMYAEPGHGRRANLLTDYTFGVWENETLVPVARAYSGLTDEEIGSLDRWIRRHTTARFGPVRHVQPLRVFELAFEGIAESDRHRGGVAMRFPRIARERTDKAARDADTLERLRALLPSETDTQGRLFE